MKLDEKKSKQQQTALNAWATNEFIGSLIAGTGFGKSRCGVVAINYVINALNRDKALILVPTVQLQDQFREEFHKWGYESCLKKTDILCYQSAHKLSKEHYDIVVCDEIHLGLSKKYRSFFEKNTYDKLLCMTATLPEEIEYQQLLFSLAPTVYSISLDKCVKLGLVSPYEINCIPIELTFGERLEYDSINDDFIRHKLALEPDAFNFAKAALKNPSVSSDLKMHAAGFYRTIRERKAIIDSAVNKVVAFQKLIGDNIDKKILVFSGANKFTDQLCDSIKPLAMSYHSGKTKKQKETALEMFRNDEINILCSTKALNQGLDIPNANLGIMCGITSKSLSMIQRIGRLIRYKKDKTGQVYILYIKNTQEEKWLKNAVKNLTNINWL